MNEVIEHVFEGICPCCDLHLVTRKGAKINGQWHGKVSVLSEEQDLMAIETYNMGNIVQNEVFSCLTCSAAIPFQN